MPVFSIDLGLKVLKIGMEVPFMKLLFSLHLDNQKIH